MLEGVGVRRLCPGVPIVVVPRWVRTVVVVLHRVCVRHRLFVYKHRRHASRIP